MAMTIPWVTILPMVFINHGIRLFRPLVTPRSRSNFFAEAQEACRKDIERPFGMLQARFAIVRGPARF